MKVLSSSKILLIYLYNILPLTCIIINNTIHKWKPTKPHQHWDFTSMSLCHLLKSPNWILKPLFYKNQRFHSAVLFGLTKMLSGLTEHWNEFAFNPLANTLLFLVSATQLYGVWKHFPSDSVVWSEAWVRPTHRAREQSCQTRASQQRKW